MAVIKKIWKWLVSNIKLVMVIACLVMIIIVGIMIGSKNKLIRSLEQKLSILQAKIKIEKLQIQYDMTMDEINKKKEEDVVLRKEIENIEEQLSKRLEGELSAEEIANKFREIGL